MAIMESLSSLANTIYSKILQKLREMKITQGYQKTFDFTREFVAKAGTADTFAIPLPTEGPFHQKGYNIMFTKNSSLERGGNTTSICAVKLRFRSQADNASQSNDYIPVQLISTPGAEDASRYGSRPFSHLYPAGDVILIDYDNRKPAALVAGDDYDMQDEKISICISGDLYPGINLQN